MAFSWQPNWLSNSLKRNSSRLQYVVPQDTSPKGGWDGSSLKSKSTSCVFVCAVEVEREDVKVEVEETRSTKRSGRIVASAGF